jgi:sulfatase modifying factor 1
VYATGAVNPTNACQSCQPGTTTTAWTTNASVNGASCGAGEVCNAGSCGPGCFIGGTVYASAAANPANACQSCQPGASTTAWTANASANGASCGTGGTCSSGTCILPTCQTPADGVNDCGVSSESCCTSPEVPAGSYFRTYVNTGSGVSGSADLATISGYRLDKYDVTVGRFRQFVVAWNNGAGYKPAPGSGKHTHLNGGSGLSVTTGGFESGWSAADNGQIAPTNANLTSTACGAYATWTNTPTTNEKLPIDCVTWEEAYAFCIWDGGFLPSDVEWGYAAEGGPSGFREYPWGSTAPGTANQYAIYGCLYNGTGTCTGVTNIAPVGTASLGAGLYGQLDLEGEDFQWVLDVGSNKTNPCTDCLLQDPTSTNRALRGSSWNYPASGLNPVIASGGSKATRSGYSFRCARVP